MMLLTAYKKGQFVRDGSPLCTKKGENKGKVLNKSIMVKEQMNEKSCKDV